MTENLLAKALRNHVGKALATMRLETADGKEKEIRIHEGFLPAQRTDNSDEYPFAIIRPVSGRIERDGTSCSVDIICGCFGREETGWQFAVNMMRRIADSLSELHWGILQSRFVLDDGMEWEMSQDQSYPAWVAVLHTTWTFRTPEDRVD